MSTYQTRRATLDDLDQLIELWKSAQLPTTDLERQFTDFQVALDEEGILAGTVAMQIEGSHGRLHSEVYADFGLTDTLRPALWKRMQVVAQNHGLFRVWTREDAPWWRKDAGFGAASEEILQKMPEAFGQRDSGWLLLQLKEESADPDRIEKEIARFKEEEAARCQRIHTTAKVIRIVGTLIAALVLGYGLIVLFLAFQHRRH